MVPRAGEAVLAAAFDASRICSDRARRELQSEGEAKPNRELSLR